MNAYAEIFQADQALDPCDAAVIEHTVIVGVAFYVGDKSFVAEELQCLIGRVGLEVYFFMLYM